MNQMHNQINQSQVHTVPWVKYPSKSQIYKSNSDFQIEKLNFNLGNEQPNETKHQDQQTNEDKKITHQNSNNTKQLTKSESDSDELFKD